MMGLLRASMNWLGDTVKGVLQRKVDAKLNAAGELWLERSRAMAPKRAGRLAAEETYQIADNTLVLIMGAPYDIYQEFGTRYIRPRPHVRPALNEMRRIFGTNVELAFNVAPSLRPQLKAVNGNFEGKGMLTPAQRAHVARHLVPASQRLHRGNVKRSPMTVRVFP